MVTKKDFKAIAEIIKKQTICIADTDSILCKAVKDIGYSYAVKLAAYFATQNPRFDRQRFLNACGL